MSHEVSDDEDMVSLASEEEDFLKRVEQESQNIEAPSSYRFVMVEGIPNQAEVQNHWARKWNIQVNSNWNIIDVENKLFIEVKVTTLSDSAINYFKVKSMGMENNAILVVVNHSTGKIKYFPRPLRAQGEDKVTSFILSRCQIMRELGISDRPPNTRRRKSQFSAIHNLWRDSIYEV